MAAREGEKLHGVDVDRIVREVLHQLGRSAPQSAQAGHGAAGAANSREIVLSASVVSLAGLPNSLAGVQRVLVGRWAVVTPAVRDALRDKNIVLERQSSAGSRFTARLVLGQANSSYDPSAVVRDMTAAGVEVEQLAQTGLATVTDEMGDAVVKDGKLGLLLTSAVHLALCLANRKRGVRAVAADSPASATAAIAAVGANLLIVDPAGRGHGELPRILRQFVTAGPRVCPAGLEKQLG